jgi:hypothetical protein
MQHLVALFALTAALQLFRSIVQTLILTYNTGFVRELGVQGVTILNPLDVCTPFSYPRPVPLAVIYPHFGVHLARIRIWLSFVLPRD